jgi:hypothetical protein
VTSTATSLGIRHANGTGWLHLAAAPTFAVMALLNAFAAVPADLLCSVGHGTLSLGGMTLMYALMGVLHAGPWWKLVAGRRDSARAMTLGFSRNKFRDQPNLPGTLEVGRCCRLALRAAKPNDKSGITTQSARNLGGWPLL